MHQALAVYMQFPRTCFDYLWPYQWLSCGPPFIHKHALLSVLPVRRVIKRHIPLVVNRKWSQIRNPEVLTVVIVRSCSSALLPFMLVTTLIPGSVSLVLLPNLRKGDQMSLSPHHEWRSRRGGRLNCQSPLLKEQKPMLQSGLVLVGAPCSSANWCAGDFGGYS